MFHFTSPEAMEPRHPLALHEAIRIGATMKPQIFGGFYNGDGTCAVAAACDAIGRLSPLGLALRLDSWPVLTRVKATCPECGCRCGQLDSIVLHLNDHHHWSRERIADWIEPIEDAFVNGEAPKVSIKEAIEPRELVEV